MDEENDVCIYTREKESERTSVAFVKKAQQEKNFVLFHNKQTGFSLCVLPKKKKSFGLTFAL
jgi:hypothetical protein